MPPRSNNTSIRTRVRDNAIRDYGPYEAIIVSHLDPLYMGGLEVEIIKSNASSGTPERSGQLVNVRYLSPFYGVTPNKGLTPNDGYQYTQKSYGMWAIPPDVGTRVLVVFAEGNTSYGYWIGCVQDVGMNFMIPDGRAATELTTQGTPNNIKGTKLPVGEYNKLIEAGSRVDPTLFEKPYNKDFTEILEVQGLIQDEARGLTTTSARRETPSMVFGISTPGPMDKRNGNPTAHYGTSTGGTEIPFNRLGGSSFVMDDGDDKFIRATHAADGPPIYLNREAGETGGDETIPQNELLRFRTRTGHQVLLHNSEDLIYIANSRGTAWIELTSDGKIDIYSKDSISMFSDQDVNITANRDFNVDAGRNINMKATARWSDGKGTVNEKESGRVQIESAFNTNIDVGKNYKLTVHNTGDIIVKDQFRVLAESDYHLQVKGSLYQHADGATHESTGFSWYRTADSNINDLAAGIYLNKNTSTNFSVEGDTKFTISGNYSRTVGTQTSITTGSSYHVEAGSGINLLGGSLVAADASQVHLNSGLSSSGSPVAASPATPATPAEIANPVVILPTIQLPYILPGAITAVSYDSILTRAPQHEPWPHHENANPYGFKPEETDREQPGHLPLNDRVLTIDTFRKNQDGVATSNFVQSRAYNAGDFTGTTGDGHVSQDTASGSTTTNSTVQLGAEDGPLETIRTSTGKSTQVAKVFAADFQGFINDLEATGYVINKLGGYSKRRAVGSSRWSVHASGGAIDINWPDQVIGGRPNGFFSPRPPNAPITDMPANTLELARKWGLGWGGAWRSLDDAMHFSKAKHEGGTVEGLRDGKVPLAPADSDPQMGIEKTEDAGAQGPQ